MEIKNIGRWFGSLIILILFASLAMSQEIIPMPNSYKQSKGFFKIPKRLTISAADDFSHGVIQPISILSKKLTGTEVAEAEKNGLIQLIRNPEILGKEAYRLIVEPKKITVEAGTTAGSFYGLQSLIQLLHNAVESGQLACCEISDQPRYEWRGLMLDESRHFFGEQEVMKILDLMALHKLNKFHWHLTDSHGWRIEIKQYPLLTKVGGIGNFSDPQAEAKFYTQKQISDIVQYAAERFIEVIPEIDMPGHATAAAKAYPEYSGGGSEKYPDFTFNPGKEETYRFLTNVLKEVSSLFPSRFIHIGGDEVSFGNQQWTGFHEIQHLMKRENLNDLKGVEHYFLRRMADSIRKIGKTMIGWDEVVTAGLTNHSLVMWWRHDQPQMLDLALKNGYEVILCPRIPLYFDFIQDDSHKSGRKWQGKYAPIESVYNFPSDRFTNGVSISTPLVKGIQANLWTETMHTPDRLEFMTFPRMSALAEAAWTTNEVKNFAGFLERMTAMKEIYQKSGVRYFDASNLKEAKEIVGPGK